MSSHHVRVHPLAGRRSLLVDLLCLGRLHAFAPLAHRRQGSLHPLFPLVHGARSRRFLPGTRRGIIGQLLYRFDLRARLMEIVLELLLAPKRVPAGTAPVLRHPRKLDQLALHQHGQDLCQ